jgi:tetratricopeptide (TPR) repeat protein
MLRVLNITRYRTMKSYTCKSLIILLLSIFLAGCVRLITQFSPSLISNFTLSFFEECDPELARQSLPAELKLLEGLLKNDPQNKQLLATLSAGFTGYSMLFVEEENPERASELYLRARDYGLKALGRKGSFLRASSLNEDKTRTGLKTIGEREIEALFFTTMPWQAWINLNLDKPVALAQMGVAQACLERVLEINPQYFYGVPYVLMGAVLAAKPGLAGGNALQARGYFEKAMQVTDGKFYLVQYYFARYYAVRIQDKQLFVRLLKDLTKRRPDELKEACLINAVMRQRAKTLLNVSGDLFL